MLQQIQISENFNFSASNCFINVVRIVINMLQFFVCSFRYAIVLGGFKIFCLFSMFALVNIKYKRKPAENEINVYSACLWFITLFHCVWVFASADLQPLLDDCVFLPEQTAAVRLFH